MRQILVSLTAPVCNSVESTDNVAHGAPNVRQMRRKVRKAIGFPASTFCPFRTISTIHLRGRPVLLGLYVSTSRRFRSTFSPISSVRKRPFWMSCPIACGETPRIRAASDCETQSRASNFFLEKVLELFKHFRLRFGMDVSHYPLPGSVRLFRLKTTQLVFQGDGSVPSTPTRP